VASVTKGEGHTDEIPTTVWRIAVNKRTTCEYCQRKIVLDIIDNDGVLIGAECVCGEYVTRYMPGQEPK
jgi:hypothetical protein